MAVRSKKSERSNGQQNDVELPDIAFDMVGQDVKKQAFLKAYVVAGTLLGAQQLSGISRQSHYNWMEKSEAYRLSFAEAHELAIQWLENKGRQRAAAKSDLLSIFLLKSRQMGRPDSYRDQVEVRSDVRLQVSATEGLRNAADRLRQLLGHAATEIPSDASRAPTALPSPADKDAV